MAMAMARSGLAVAQKLQSCGESSFRGEQMFSKRGSVAFADGSHERFYALRVRCGKKKERLAVKVSKVQDLVKVQRELITSSSVAVSDPLMDRIITNLQELQAEVASLNVKVKKKKAGSSSSSPSSSSSSSSDSSEDDVKGDIAAVTLEAKRRSKKDSSSPSSSSSSSSSESDTGKAMDMRAFRNKLTAVRAARSETVTSPAPQQFADEEEHPVVAQIRALCNTASAITEEEPAAARSATPATEQFADEEEHPIVAQIRALCNTATSVETKVTPAARSETVTERFAAENDSSAIAARISSELASISTRENFTRGPNGPIIVPSIDDGVIEVCTGGKCKRGGALQILASLQESLPESSNIAVTSCKCMGKCKSAPNVRLKTGEGRSLLSNVAVDDVHTLLDHFGMPSTMPLFASNR